MNLILVSPKIMVNYICTIAKLQYLVAQFRCTSFEQVKVMLLSIQIRVSLDRPLVPWSIVKVITVLKEAV